ncbi:MAG: hypothetical protein JO368_02570 [Acidimicrobiales bacterium]|nr:hypothetical protein [Acidimicrobiales bacterium]
MRLIHSGGAGAVGVTGVLTIAGAAAIAFAASPAHVAAVDRPGMLAFVGVGQTICNDDNATQQQGGTGKVVNKACYNTSAVILGPSISTLGWLANLSTSVDNTVANGNAIGNSPHGAGTFENNGIGA